MIKRVSALLALVAATLVFGAGTANAQVRPDDLCHTGNVTADAACQVVAGQGWN